MGSPKKPRANRVPKRTDRPGVDRYGRPPLWYAAANGEVGAVKAALAEGVDANGGDDDGYTPLHVACQNGHFEVVKLLLEAGADVNRTDDHGNGPLWTASFQAMRANAPASQVNIVAALLRAGADPDAKNRYGRSSREVITLAGRIDLLW